MQLFAQTNIETAIAEFISAAFSKDERDIARLRARINRMPPRSHSRVILQKEICEIRLRQLRSAI